MTTTFETLETSAATLDTPLVRELDLGVTRLDETALRMPYGSSRMNALCVRMPYGSVRMNRLGTRMPYGSLRMNQLTAKTVRA